MPTHMQDTGDLGNDTPRPVYADSVANGTFQKLEQGQGATHARAHARVKDEQPPIDKRTLAVVIVGALVAIGVIVALFIAVLSRDSSVHEEQKEAEQVAVQTDQSLTSRGAEYELQEKDGKYLLIEKREGGQGASLGELPGTPAGLILYDGAVLIPENLKGGTWDVMAYTIGSGWSQIKDRDGNVVGGEGTVESAELEGTTIVLSVDGSRVEVPLVW